MANKKVENAIEDQVLDEVKIKAPKKDTANSAPKQTKSTTQTKSTSQAKGTAQTKSTAKKDAPKADSAKKEVKATTKKDTADGAPKAVKSTPKKEMDKAIEEEVVAEVEIEAEILEDDAQEARRTARKNAKKAAEVEAEFDIGIVRDGMTDEDYISALERKLGKTLAELHSSVTTAQRLQADFDNYRRRNASLSEDMKTLGQTVVIEKFLTVLDNCDLARRYIHDEAALVGFNMMEDQILDILEGFGLAMVDTDDADFDVRMMSAVDRVKCASRKGKVVEVMSKGYTFKGRLLRPASVKIGY